MKYNTTPIKNIDDELFIGRFSGIDFIFEPGNIRFLPSHISQHLAKQLMMQITKKFEGKKEKAPLNLIDEILQPEIMTAENTENLTLKEEVDRHELEIKKWQEGKEREEDEKRIKAEGIIEKEDFNA